jgi:hypothetical protein
VGVNNHPPPLKLKADKSIIPRFDFKEYKNQTIMNCDVPLFTVLK